MTTLQQLIDENKHRPVRKCYIKRKQLDGTYESNWVQINNDVSYGRERVIDWGEVTLNIDSDPSQIGVFDISNLVIVFNNEDGYFNVETDLNSKWNGFLNRKFTKFKIDCGYLDADDNEVGVSTVFEGVLNKVIVREDNLATVNLLSYVNILKQYDISDMNLTGSDTVSNTVDEIMNQSKITDFIPFVASNPDVDATISDRSLLSGTYYAVLVDLAYKSNSTIFLNNTAWNFKKREVSGSSVFDFKGIGSQQPVNIFKILNYDDEGGERVRVYWNDTVSGKIAQTSNTKLQNKYLSSPQQISLDYIQDSDRDSVLKGLLSTWEFNKPRIEFSTKFLVNIVSPLNLISIEYFGTMTPVGLTTTWGGGLNWGVSSSIAVWGRATGGIIIFSGQRWLVTAVKKNINDWSTIIVAEKILN